MSDHRVFMDQAIRLAEHGRGRTAPNPCVGAVLAHGGLVAAEGFHSACGQPHAEIEALRHARTQGVNPAECVLYVTLEPCNHQGKTPPCTRAILEAGIREVVIGCADPNPVAGGGADVLRQHGVTVRMGVREEQCRDLIADFLVWQTTKRPFSILKLATTLDGKIAARDGQAAWITGEASRREVHHLRSWCGAVIVGGGTLRSDNPFLTCRLPDYDGPQPLAVVVTRALPDPAQNFHLLTERAGHTIFWTGLEESHSVRATRLTNLGAAVWGLPDWNKDHLGRLDLNAGLGLLRRDRNCHYTLTEGGGHLAASMQEQGLVDELRIFQAMKVLGDEQAPSAFAGRPAVSMGDCWNFRLVEQTFFETDLYLRLRPKE